MDTYGCAHADIHFYHRREVSPGDTETKPQLSHLGNLDLTLPRTLSKAAVEHSSTTLGWVQYPPLELLRSGTSGQETFVLVLNGQPRAHWQGYAPAAC